MKTEFLKEILKDIPEETQKTAIDAIMAENGKDIKVVQDKLTATETETGTLKTQIAERDKQIEELGKLDAEGMKAKIAELDDKYSKEAAERKADAEKYASDIAKRDFDAELDKHLGELKAKDAKSVKAHLDIETLMKSQNRSEDIKTAIEAVQKEKDFLFESDEPHKNPVGPTGHQTPPGDAQTAIMRAAAGLPAEPAKEK